MLRGYLLIGARKYAQRYFSSGTGRRGSFINRALDALLGRQPDRRVEVNLEFKLRKPQLLCCCRWDSGCSVRDNWLRDPGIARMVSSQDTHRDRRAAGPG